MLQTYILSPSDVTIKSFSEILQNQRFFENISLAKKKPELYQFYYDIYLCTSESGRNKVHTFTVTVF